MHKDGELTTVQVAELARVTYRQIDYWVRHAYLPCEDSEPGSGGHRMFTPEEAELARVFAALVHAGVMPAAAGSAVCCGRAAIGPEKFSVELGALVVTGPLP